MSSEKAQMAESLKKIFIPILRDKGFKGSFPHFRRILADKTNLLTFQFDRKGGGFVIEIANYIGNEFKTPWGDIITLNKLSAHDLQARQRIYPHAIAQENGTDSWFRYDRKTFISLGNKFDKISNQVVRQLPLMEEYWNR